MQFYQNSTRWPKKLEMGKTHKLLKSHCSELERQPQPLCLVPPKDCVNCYFLSSSLHEKIFFFTPPDKPSNLKPFADLFSVSFGAIPLPHLHCLIVVSKTACKLLQIPPAPRNTATNTKYEAESWSIWRVIPKYTIKFWVSFFSYLQLFLEPIFYLSHQDWERSFPRLILYIPFQ